MYNKKRALMSIMFLLILFYLGFLTTQGVSATQGMGAKDPAMQGPLYQGPQVPKSLLSQPDSREAEASLAEPEAQKPGIQSPVEAFFNKYENKKYTQFGYKIFQTALHPRIPVVGPDYLLGPGDEISINMWGQAIFQLRSENKLQKPTNKNNLSLEQALLQASSANKNNSSLLERALSQLKSANEKNSSLLEYNLIVDKKGHLLLPEFGPLSVSGLCLGNLEGILTAKYKELYKDCQAEIALSNIRKIDILVSGQVEKPGYVSVQAGSTVYETLLAAGGCTKMGSLRNVMLRKADNKTQMIDLYRLIVSQDEVHLPQLREKDILSVPHIGPTVLIKGQIRCPGIYEIMEGENLNDLVRYAGKAFPNTNFDQIKISRFNSAGGRQIMHIKGLNTKMALQDGDLVTLKPIKADFKNSVSLTGHVYRLRYFGWSENLCLHDILTSYDQMQPEAALDYGEIKRHQGHDLHPVILVFHPQRLLEGDEGENIGLQPGDSIRIYSKQEIEEKLKKKAEEKLMVEVSGAVQKSGKYIIGKDTRLVDIIKEAGGLIPEAYLPGLVLMRSNAREVQTAYRQVAVELLKKDLVWQSAESAREYLSEKEKNEEKQAVANIQSYLSHLESQAPEGRIVLASDDLVSLQKFEQSCSNVPLKNGDKILVPTTPGFISIVGEIYRPSSYLFLPKKKVADYLALAGGISPYADLSASFLVRSSGQIMSYQQKQKQFLQMVMHPGDVVVLPSKVLLIQGDN